MNATITSFIICFFIPDTDRTRGGERERRTDGRVFIALLVRAGEKTNATRVQFVFFVLQSKHEEITRDE